MTDHPLINWMNDYGRHEGERGEEAIKNRFMCLDNPARTSELQAISSWLEQPGSSLREKSQLAKLGRELGHLHESLRKVGR